MHAAWNSGIGFSFLRCTVLILSVVLIGSMGVLRAQSPVGGANVNVISGTGPDGDWTLQRQNEPTMACSSRNPQNCLAGANDYRTVDIPFPADRRTDHRRRLARVVHDQGRRPDLADAAAARVPAGSRPRQASNSPLRGYTAGADPIIRPGTNGLFYYGGHRLRPRREGAAARSSSRGSSTTTIRKVTPANRLPISARRSSADRAGVTRRARRGQRGERGARSAVAEARHAGSAGARPGVEYRRAAVAAAADPDRRDGRQALDGRRYSARRRADVHHRRTRHRRAAADVSRRPRLHGVHALRWRRRGARARSCSARRSTAAATWSAPRMISRVQSADVNDDGVANDRRRESCSGKPEPQLRAGRLQRQRRHQQRLHHQRVDLASSAAASGVPFPKQPRPLAGRDARHRPAARARCRSRGGSSSDGVNCPTRSSRSAPPTAARPSLPRPRSSLINPFDQGTTATSFRTNALSDADDGRHRPRVPRLVDARLRADQSRPGQRRRPHRDLDLAPTARPGPRRSRQTTNRPSAIRSCRR